MSYTPNTWATGDVITPAKLNNMENGITEANNGGSGSGNFIVTAGTFAQNFVLDKTYAEIFMALKNKIPSYLSVHASDAPDEEDIDSTYDMSLVFAPITNVSKYDTMYRVYASFSSTRYYSSLSTSLGTPATIVFQASSANSYPTYLRTVYVPDSNTSTSTGIS